MSDIGACSKRHVAVPYPKKWRRKRRKPAGTISTAISPTEESHPSRFRYNEQLDVLSLTPEILDRNESEPPRPVSPEIPDHSREKLNNSNSDSDVHDIASQEQEDNLTYHEPADEVEGKCQGNSRTHCNHGETKLVEDLMLKKHVLSALCMIIGSSRLTKKQYNFSRALINHEGSYEKRRGYPAYSTLSSNILPVMRKHVYVPNVKLQLKVDYTRSGAQQPFSNSQGESVSVMKPVKLILPSSWGKKDVCTMPYFTSETSHSSKNSRCPVLIHEDIELTSIVQQRALYFCSDVLQTVLRTGTVLISENIAKDANDVEVILHKPPRRANTILSSLETEQRIENGHGIVVLKGKLTTTCLQEQTDGSFAAGDLVSILDIPGRPPELTVFLVHGMRRLPNKPAQAIILRTGTASNNDILVRCKRVSAYSSALDNPEHPLPHPHFYKYGRLQDGRLYSVYRVILYSDDFNNFAHKKGSAGGFYMLPVSLPLEKRRGKGAVRVISLTPPGISTNEAILSVIPDFVSSAKNGFEEVDYFGVRRSVFIEVLGYIGDYVAVQHVLDLTGPRGIAPCPLCTFRKGSHAGATTSEYAYSVLAHSGHASFRRDKRRMRALRRTSVNPTDLQDLGLQNIATEEYSKLPLHALSDALEKVRNEIPKTEHGKPVVSTQFDPYLSALVAPDHLFHGLGEDVINANMRILSKKQRILAEYLMQHALHSNGLETEPRFYDQNKLRLHSMSISTMFNLLLVAPWAVYHCQAYNSDGEKKTFSRIRITGCIELLFKFQKLVSDTLFFPKCDVDGKDAVIRYNEANGQHRLRSLKRSCAEYIQAVDVVCAHTPLAKKELDKPNIHRLLELYNHTIPILGHIRHGQELLFEAAHQPLKRALKQSNYKDSQLTAMDEIMANDWKSRLGETLHANGISRNTEISSETCVKLKQLMCGDRDIEHSAGGLNHITMRIRECFKPSVIEHLLSTSRELNGEQMREWVPFDSKKDNISAFSCVTNTNAAITYISSLYQNYVDNGAVIKRVMYAKSVYKNPTSNIKTSGSVPNNSVHLLQRLDVIQAAVEDFSQANAPGTELVKLLFLQEEYEDCSSSPSCTRRFWLLLDLLTISEGPYEESGRSDSLFAVVWPITPRNTETFPISKYYDLYSVTEKGAMFIINLKASVRKAMSFHLCNWNHTSSCSVTPNGQSCTHTGSIYDGEPFILFGSAEGFPPRDG